MFRVQRSDQRGGLRLAGQDRGCQTHPLVVIMPGLVELVLDRALGVLWQDGVAHQLADKETIAFFGGRPACRGVGLL